MKEHTNSGQSSTSPIRNFWGAILSATVGACSLFYLSIQHYKIHFGLADAKSICNLSEKLNCDAVAVSKFATLGFIPVSVVGVAFFVVMIGLLLINKIGLTENPQRISRYIWIGATLGVLASVVMGIISLIFLKTFCLFCILTYIMTLLFFLFATLMLSPGWKNELTTDIVSLFGPQAWVIGFILAVPLLSILANSIAYDLVAPRLSELIEESIADWKSAPTNEFSAELGVKKREVNSAQIKMTIVEFADFLCPHCKAAGPSLNAFAEGHSDVQLIFKVFPLDGVCNQAIQSKHDGLRCQLAYALFCADKIDKKGEAFQFHIFDRQTEWTTSNLKENLQEISEKLGLTFDQIDQCMNQEDTKNQVLLQAQEGAKAKIQGTPSIFVNGKILSRGQFIPVLQGVYNSL